MNFNKCTSCNDIVKNNIDARITKSECIVGQVVIETHITTVASRQIYRTGIYIVRKRII